MSIDTSTPLEQHLGDFPTLLGKYPEFLQDIDKYYQTLEQLLQAEKLLPKTDSPLVELEVQPEVGLEPNLNQSPEVFLDAASFPSI
jgi:hypothetical protein